MNYPLKPKQRKNPYVKSAWTFVIVVFVLVYVLSVLQSTALFGIVSPVWRAKAYTKNFVTTHVGFLQGKQTLIDENNQLKQKMSEVYELELLRDALQKENEVLKGFSGSGQEGSEWARVLTSPSQSAYDVVTAELGPNSSVSVGDMVFGQHNIVLGTVIDRKGTFIRIQYFSNPGVKTVVQMGNDMTSVEVLGQGGGNFLFIAPRDFVVNQGDLVVLPAFTTSIMGRVEAVESLRADSLKNVYIAYPINLSSVTFVRIQHVDKL